MARHPARRTPHHAFRETPTTRVLPYPQTVLFNATKRGRDTRILIVTETFLDLLSHHPWVINLYTRWENRFELYRRANDVLLYSVQLAKDLNVSDVYTLTDETVKVCVYHFSESTFLHAKQAIIELALRTI